MSTKDEERAFREFLDREGIRYRDHADRVNRALEGMKSSPVDGGDDDLNTFSELSDLWSELRRLHRSVRSLRFGNGERDDVELIALGLDEIASIERRILKRRSRLSMDRFLLT